MSDPVTQLLADVVKSLGGQERPGQVEMAQQVTEALRNNEHLLIQAGTGTGKSLGYLVPALLDEDRVVIATATLALQNQLVTKDIPALFEAAKTTADFAVVKGRSNYACLQRVRDGAPADEQGELIQTPDSEIGKQVLELRKWAEEQAEADLVGDKESAPSHVDLAWRQVSVSARECLGSDKCPYSQECFAEKAKKIAEGAKIVVTNHAVLAIDAIDGVPLLPSYEKVIIDEAHELNQRVTQAATRDLGPGAIERMTRSLGNQVEPGVRDDLFEAADVLRNELQMCELGRIDPLPKSVIDALVLVVAGARAALSELSKGETDAARQLAKANMTELRDTAERIATASDSQVVWLTEGRGPELHIAPLDVAQSLRTQLFDRKTAVLTSATLQIGGGFDLTKRQLGLDGAEAFDVGSPFDYAKQGILYVAAHLPSPGRDGLSEETLAELVTLVEAAGGHTLGLFSSRRAAEQAAEYAREKLPELKILCQGDAQLSELIKEFTTEPKTSLFGTISLWQGLDAPGDLCRLVIIDRIPFPRPDDPLMSARAQKAGPRGFMDVSAAHAALLLAQGAGRLIRRSTDKGVIAVLDSRLRTARYGAFLLRTMPPMWTTTEPETALEALQRLR